MTPEAQRIAIARACGWHATHDIEAVDIPDYLSDLNACHEMEKVLTKAGQQHAYWKTLTEVKQSGWRYDIIHATAAQRSEAFLKTLNIWKDDQ